MIITLIALSSFCVDMKKILLIAFLVFPAVTMAQNLILVCEGAEETTYRQDNEKNTRVAQYTYVFKNGKLTETTTNIAHDNVKWTENYIEIIKNSKTGSMELSTHIDRISGAVSRLYIPSDNDNALSTVLFQGICRNTTRKF
jgi:hypothetical protein